VVAERLQKFMLPGIWVLASLATLTSVNLTFIGFLVAMTAPGVGPSGRYIWAFAELLEAIK